MATVDRARLIVQKRTSLKGKMTNILNLIDTDRIDNDHLKFRMDRLGELYRDLEELQDELMLLEPENNHDVEFASAEDKFYSLKVKTTRILVTTPAPSVETPSGSREIGPSVIHNSNTSYNRCNIKLPQTTLPTFDGDYLKWFSFKNSFKALIDSRSDISDTAKFHYLKTALQGDASGKLDSKGIDAEENCYAKAWEVLNNTFDAKRIIIDKHLSALANLPMQERETAEGLIKLGDEVQLHAASLTSLGIAMTPEQLVFSVQSKLHKFTMAKWEQNLDRNEYPTLKQMLDFLNKTAICASRNDKRESSKTDGSSKFQPPNKKKRFNDRSSRNQTLVIQTSNNCVVCKDRQHPLYKCDKFREKSVRERIDIVKQAKICLNCLRYHRDKTCSFGNCKICDGKHNALLHRNSYKAKGSDTTAAPANTQHQDAGKEKTD